MSLQNLFINFYFFLNDAVIPFILAIAFLFFIWNAFVFFFAKGATEDGREKAKRLMIWGILAFVIILSIWGIVNLLVYGLGFGYNAPLTPDFVGRSPGGYTTGGAGGGTPANCTDLILGFVWCW